MTLLNRSIVAGIGSYLPEKVLTNDDLARMVDTSDEWIRKRTGIERRHIAAEGELTSDLAMKAALAALEHAGAGPDDVDLIVLATTVPDNTFPATAARVQAKLGVKRGPAFDVQAVCSGFIYALSIADNMLKLGQARSALVIGAEVYSRILDWSDRSTCVLFGDGAGAMFLRAVPPDEVNGRGILSTHLWTDGSHYDALYVDGGPSSTQTAGHVQMQGQEVYRGAVKLMADAVEVGLAANGMTTEELDWLVPHQANVRIIDSVGSKLGIGADRTIVTVAEHANTSAATIPLALDIGSRDQRIQTGDLIALTALGGGFSWGSAILRW